MHHVLADPELLCGLTVSQFVTIGAPQDGSSRLIEALRRVVDKANGLFKLLNLLIVTECLTMNRLLPIVDGSFRPAQPVKTTVTHNRIEIGRAWITHIVLPTLPHGLEHLAHNITRFLHVQKSTGVEEETVCRSCLHTTDAFCRYRCCLSFGT